MAKRIILFLSVLLVGLLIATPSGAQEAKISLASGKVVKVNYRRMGGQVYFPLRNLAEGFGAQYTWSGKNSTATIIFGKGKIQLSPNNPGVWVKDKEVVLTLSPKILSKHLYVPGEFLTGPFSELLGQEVVYQLSTTVLTDKSSQKILKNLRWYAYSSHTRVVLDLSHPLSYEITREDSSLIQVLLKEASLSPEMEERGETAFEKDPLLRSYNAYQTDRGAVIEIAAQGEGIEYSHFFLKSPPRVVLDVAKGTRKQSEASSPPAEMRPPLEKFEVPKKQPPPEGEFKITRPADPAVPGALRTIVLDPGHGDFDSGAVGPTGLREKDVVLDVAMRLAPLLETKLGLKIILTRKSDIFVPLRERTRIANRYQADLFVSIHANADKSKRGRGVETFFLDLEPSDEEARAVAALENGVINLEKNAAQELNALANLLWDLTETAHQRESSQLAEIVQNALEKNLSSPGRGVKTAHFYVLRGALMPAILTEVGFITHREEEKKLRNAEYRQAIAESLFKSIAEYKNIYEKRMGVAQRP
jgi:N-acetylmuramoyl-L-alanine amidase